MARYVPPDWPERVQPPGTEGWEASAVTWLLELVPEFRQYGAVCRLIQPANKAVFDV